jgi:GMP synthase-like glutamine amidotransferase
MVLTRSTTRRNVTVWVADGWATQTLDYGTRLAEQLADGGATVERRDLTAVRGDEPLSSGLHVLTGGITSVNDAGSWMPAAKMLVHRMIRHAEEGHSQLLGVCLGSQIVADCLAPGSVVRGPVITAGLIEVAWSTDEGVSDELGVLPAFHYEQVDPVAAQRAGIDVIATGPATPVIAYRYGTRVAGIQLHPELSAADMLELLTHNGDVVTRYGGDPSKIRQDSEELADRLSPRALPQVVEHLLSRATSHPT